jgi:hypothetical protein
MICQELRDCLLDQGLDGHGPKNRGNLELAAFRFGNTGAELVFGSALRAGKPVPGGTGRRLVAGFARDL